MTSPASHLVGPVAVEPIPATLEAVLRIPALTSVSYWITEFSDLIGLPTTADYGSWFGGDWERVARAADACRNLGAFCTTLASGTRRELDALEAGWLGNAAGAASGYFSHLADQLDANAVSFTQIATQLDQTAIGVHEAAQAIGSLNDHIIDLAITFFVTSWATAASAATGVGAVASTVTTPALAATVLKGISVVEQILSIHANASLTCSAFVGLIATPMATVKGFPAMSVPAPYDNPQVDS